MEAFKQTSVKECEFFTNQLNESSDDRYLYLLWGVAGGGGLGVGGHHLLGGGEQAGERGGEGGETAVVLARL